MANVAKSRCFYTIKTDGLYMSVWLQGSGPTVFTVKYTNGRVETAEEVETSITTYMRDSRTLARLYGTDSILAGETHIIKFHTYKIITPNSGVRGIWLWIQFHL